MLLPNFRVMVCVARHAAAAATVAARKAPALKGVVAVVRHTCAAVGEALLGLEFHHRQVRGFILSLAFLFHNDIEFKGLMNKIFK